MILVISVSIFCSLAAARADTSIFESGNTWVYKFEYHEVEVTEYAYPGWRTSVIDIRIA